MSEEHRGLVNCVLRSQLSLGANDAELRQKVQELDSQMSQRTHILFAFSMPLISQEGQEYPLLDHTTEYANIRASVSRIGKNLRLKSICATQNNFRQILAENPIALHFSGHGSKDSLVLEQDEDGTPFYLHREELTEICAEIHARNCREQERLKKCEPVQCERRKLNEIQFVFVASCHSENMAAIFRRAGVKHVICIREDHPVSDDAMLFFTNKFYNILFCQDTTICHAFWQAKRALLSKRKLKKEAMKFLIIRDVDDYEHTPRHEFYGNQLKNQKACDCWRLGPFDPGCFQDLNKLERPIFSMAAELGGKRVVGRSLEINQVVRLLNEHRLVSVLGHIGIGKGKVAESVALRLQERSRFKDGVMHISMRNQEYAGALIDSIIKVLKMAEQLQSPAKVSPESEGCLSGQKQRQLQ